MMRAKAVAAALSAVACAAALREPPPVSTMAPGTSGGESAAELVRAADAAWARRADPRQAKAAQDLYLDAAAADERRADALLGAMRALSFRIEREKDASVRGQLAQQEVQLGQWCQRRAPAEPACDYRLAIALGQQARERASTGKDAVGKMVELLRKAIAAAPALDSAGPHRVLALVLLRAPGWPLGPGDPEAALAEAREAARLFPDAPENQLALAEALGKNGSPGEARAAYQRALELATSAGAAGDPDAGRQREEASAGLARYGGRRPDAGSR
jgi:tetratricopeptide (TPR) repeat protein